MELKTLLASTTLSHFPARFASFRKLIAGPSYFVFLVAVHIILQTWVSLRATFLNGMRLSVAFKWLLRLHAMLSQTTTPLVQLARQRLRSSTPTCQMLPARTLLPR